MMIYGWLYGFFIGIHHCIAALELEEYYLTETSLWESVEYDIVASLPDEDHILGCVWEVRKGWEYLLIDLSKYAIARTLDCRLAYFSVFVCCDDAHDKNPDNESDKSSEYESQWVHSVRRRRTIKKQAIKTW